VALDFLIRAKLVVMPASLQSTTYAFGWSVATVAFKHTLAIVFSEKGEEADLEEYFAAIQVIVSIVISSHVARCVGDYIQPDRPESKKPRKQKFDAMGTLCRPLLRSPVHHRVKCLYLRSIFSHSSGVEASMRHGLSALASVGFYFVAKTTLSLN
jgi:hypothetical protein